MKQLALLAVFAFFAGCQSSVDQAPANLKKGDSFYNSKDFDVAEYYYQKVPEESPLYAHARAKLDSIDAFRKYWSMKTVPESELKDIVLEDHSGSLNRSTMKPLHSFVLINNTPRTLSAVTIEFIYFDENHNETGRLTCDVDAPVPSKKKAVFNRVEPGTLKRGFYKSEAKLLGAEY